MRLKKIEAMAEPRIPPDRAGEVEARRRFRLRVLGVVSLLVLAVVVVWWWKGRFVSTTGRVVAYEVLVNAAERGRIVSLPSRKASVSGPTRSWLVSIQRRDRRS